MAQDPELERLATAQELAFQRRQAAYETMQSAWEQRSSRLEAKNRASDVQKRAYEEQASTWQQYRHTKDSNGPRIDSLKAQQEAAYQNMKRSFEAASSAYESRDGASAKSYATEGHRYKAEAQHYVAELRLLFEENRTAKAPHVAAETAFGHAKQVCQAAKRSFDQAKADHERALSEFKQRKEEAERAKNAFHKRLDQLKAQNKTRQEEKRSLAEKADVPFQYRDKVRVSKDSDGNTNIYFGGFGQPDGPGHGHYVLDRSGTVTYQRDPFDPHGAQNFKSGQTDYFDAIRSESVSGTEEFGFRCTYKGLPAMVETGYDSRTGRQKINIFYGAGDGMVGRGHGHAIAYRDAPFTIIEDRPPR